jgi:A/G-specific adenine glycosylase
LRGLCVAYREGEPARYPVKTRTRRRGVRRNAMLWLTDGARCWLVRQPARGVWGGLWSLPLFDSIDAVRALTRHWPGRARALAPIDHALTHFDWRLEPWRHALPPRTSAARRSAIEALLPAGRWFSLVEAPALGMPAPVRKLLKEGR